MSSFREIMQLCSCVCLNDRVSWDGHDVPPSVAWWIDGRWKWVDLLQCDGVLEDTINKEWHRWICCEEVAPYIDCIMKCYLYVNGECMGGKEKEKKEENKTNLWINLPKQKHFYMGFQYSLFPEKKNNNWIKPNSKNRNHSFHSFIQLIQLIQWFNEYIISHLSRSSVIDLREWNVLRVMRARLGVEVHVAPRGDHMQIKIWNTSHWHSLAFQIKHKTR